MLVIRREQIQALSTLGVFEKALVAHLFRFSPTHCRGIGESGVLAAVRLGIARAAACGFTTRGPVRFYVELMFMFGSYFDNDPQLPPQVSALLHGQPRRDPLQRADRLHAETSDYLRHVVGPGNAYARQAVGRFRRVAAEPLGLTTDTLRPGLLALMQALYPQRHAYVGPAALAGVIERGIAMAKAKSLTDVRGAALCTLLMFELGHGCFEDPLYPWIGRSLRPDPAAKPDAEARTRRLERRVVRYIQLIEQRLQADAAASAAIGSRRCAVA